MLPLAIIIFLLGLILLWYANQRRKASGLPIGQVIYSDTKKWEPVPAQLFDPVIGLTGRPDYLIRDDQQVIPVEVKSSHIQDSPYEGHLLQLAAYCYLVNATYAVRPRYGIINYPQKTFRVDFSFELESELIKLIEELQNLADQREINRSHNSIARCRSCGFETKCNQSLIKT